MPEWKRRKFTPEQKADSIRMVREVGNMAKVALTLVAGLGLLSCAEGRAAPSHPDVVLVVVDTLRADHMSCYGYDRPTTPFLETLAEEGCLFQDVTAQSSWTLPSMVSLMTGRYVTSYRDLPDPEVPMLAELFQAAGYRTLGIAGNYLLRPEEGWSRGFDTYDGRTRRDSEGKLVVLPREIDDLALALSEPLDRALELDETGARPPLFLYLHLFDPHAPYRARQAYDAELPAIESPEVRPAGWWEETFAAYGPPPRARAGGETGSWRADFDAMRVARGRYDHEIRFLDEGLERIFQGLRAKGVLEQAVFALVADHGEGLWERVAGTLDDVATRPPRGFFYQQHGHLLFGEAVATPFLLWGAGVPRGRRISTPVENVDLVPTLLELTGLAARGPLHGRSLVPLVQAEEPPDDWRGEVYSFTLYGASVRDLASGEKLIEPSDIGVERGHDSLFFDLERDPWERTNLYAPDSAGAARLSALLDLWAERHPTRNSLGQPKDRELQDAIQALGYAGLDD